MFFRSLFLTRLGRSLPLGCACAAALGAATPSGSDDVGGRYANVAGWEGFWEVVQTESETRSTPSVLNRREERVTHGHFRLARPGPKVNAAGGPAVPALRDETAARFIHTQMRAAGQFTWTGTGEASGRFAMTQYRGDGAVWDSAVGAGHAAGKNGGLEFKIDLRLGQVALSSPDNLDLPITYQRTGVLRESGPDKRNVYRSFAETWTSRGSLHSPGGVAGGSAGDLAQVRAGPGVLVFNKEKREGNSVRRTRVLLAPVYDDVDCEVTIKGYEDWRPLGNLADPTKPGNRLVVRAVLKARSAATKELPEVDRFRFELRDTSREPGVCLNWPLGAKDEEFDLRLANVTPAGVELEDYVALAKRLNEWGWVSGGEYDLGSMPPQTLAALFASGRDGQKGDVAAPRKNKAGQPFADAVIESFDFGGKAELRVVCRLKDGRDIIGLMKDAGGGTDLVRLPKRAPTDWIAAKWRRDNAVTELAGDDDEEKIEGQPLNGDGFTLYEEYRGWAVNGKHVTGDPKRKDFFVLNQIGADAVGGIALFERASKIRVLGRLRATEMSETLRLMNGNRRDAPHRVDQHGVWLISPALESLGDTGKSGGKTYGLAGRAAAFAFRPAAVERIVIEPRAMGSGVFQAGLGENLYSLDARDAALAYDRAVAHELLHAVGVDHHGEGESSNPVWFVAADDPNNPTRRAGFSTFLPRITDWKLRVQPGDAVDPGRLRRNAVISLFWEDTRRNIGEELAPRFERKRAAEAARRAADPAFEDPGLRASRYPGYGRDAAYWRATDLYDRVSYLEPEFNLHMTVGRVGEADSGDERCLMRYYFANAYPINGKTDAFYLVRPGPEANRAGRELCRHPAGTLHNASTHQPQPRFGDAAPGRGGCFAQICPNDAIPPRAL